MEEKNIDYEGSHSFAMTLLAELRLQYAKQMKILYIFIFIIATLLSYIFYDRWLDSKVESNITTESYITQDNATGVDNLSSSISNNIK